ncbi:MAG: hypothetical protein LH473_09550, partial [Chitinophagales bacterium]|nr:hypothetical protein [Chitinophagales bacterium]
MQFSFQIKLQAIKIEKQPLLKLILTFEAKIKTATENYSFAKFSTLITDQPSMNKHLEKVLTLLQQPNELSADEKTTGIQELKAAEAELEMKNRDLKIESSLERVRVVALSMKKPEELLNVCEILFSEMSSLGFSEMRNTMINIHNDEKETFVNYDYSNEIGKSVTPLFYSIHPLIEKQIKQIRSADDAFSETSFAGKELEEWKAFRRSRGEKDDPRIDKVAALHYYFYSIGVGSIGISTFSALSAEKLELLKRFRNVFDFAYRRYMDIALAEAQAREAQIEAALERVRSVAMSMKQATDMLDVCKTISRQLELLGVKEIRNIQTAIFNEEKGTYYNYEYYTKHNKTIITETDYKNHPVHKKFAEQMLKGAGEVFIHSFKGKEVKEWIKYQKTTNVFIDSFLEQAEALCYYWNSLGPVALGMSTYILLNEEEIELFKRFKNVFELAYQRYSDIALAEEQAHKAQTETAMEYVRSRALAMQEPEELIDVAQMLRHEMGILGIQEIETGTVFIFDEVAESAQFGFTMKDTRFPEKPSVTETITVQLNTTSAGKELLSFFLSQEVRQSFRQEGLKRKEWIEYMYS